MQINKKTNNLYISGVRQVLLITLCLNIAVFIVKLIAGLVSGSLSVISDSVHSAGDSINNIIGLVVMKYAAAEPDEGNPYVHAKFETLATFTIAGFLLITCFEICENSLKRLLNSDASPPEITTLTLGAMICTIIVNLVVTTYERRCGKRLNSKFLIADAIHTRSDVLVSCSVLIGLFLTRKGYVWLDPLVSLGVAVFIAWNCYQIFKMTVPTLVDAGPIPPAHIAEIVERVPGVHSVHNVRSRLQHSKIVIEMHLRVYPGIEHGHPVSHAITEKIARWLVEEEFGHVAVTVHIEPLTFPNANMANGVGGDSLR